MLTKRTHFSNLHQLMEPPRAWKNGCCWICYTTQCFQFYFSSLEVCGMSWNDSWTKTTRIPNTNDRTSSKHHSDVIVMLAQCHDSPSEYLQPNLMPWNPSPAVWMEFSQHASICLQTAKLLGYPCSDYSFLFDVNIQEKYDNHSLVSLLNLYWKDINLLH